MGNILLILCLNGISVEMDGKYVSLSKGGLGAGICGDGLMQQTLSIHGGTTPVIGVGSNTDAFISSDIKRKYKKEL